MCQTSHLESLYVRLSNEQSRLDLEKSDQGRVIRKVWVSQIQKEIEQEEKFLGISEEKNKTGISDDELLRDLLG